MTHLWARIQRAMDDAAARDAWSRRPSQADIARATGITPQTLNKWAAGDTKLPEARRLRQVAAALMIPYGELLEAVLRDRDYVADDERADVIVSRIARSISDSTDESQASGSSRPDPGASGPPGRSGRRRRRPPPTGPSNGDGVRSRR